MSSVKQYPEHFPRHIAALLDVAQDQYRTELRELGTRELETTSDERLMPIIRRMRGSLFRMLSVVPPEGARVTDLADYARMTKQSAGELLAQLAELGLIVSTVDPGDRRTKLTRRTDDGDALVAFAEKSIARVEQRWRRRVGAADYETMRRVLSQLVGL